MRIGMLICSLFYEAMGVLSGWGLFILHKPNMNPANKRYAACKEKGKMGGRKPKQNQTDNQTNQSTDNQTEQLTENQTGQWAENQRHNLELELELELESELELELDSELELESESALESDPDASAKGIAPHKERNQASIRGKQKLPCNLFLSFAP